MTAFRRDRSTVRIGDVIAIPLKHGYAVAKVIYVSEVLRHVIALRVVEKRFDSPDAPDLERVNWLPGLFYTGSQSIPKYWKVVGRSDVTPAEEEETRRLVAGHVWEVDRDLGAASPAQRRELRSMGVLGMYGLQDVLDGELP